MEMNGGNKMKEYKVQMLFNGKWISGHRPNNIHYKTSRNKEEMIKYMCEMGEAWRIYRIKLENLGYDTKLTPETFRIVSREITEWEEE